MKVSQSRLLSMAVLACALASNVEAKAGERRGLFAFGRRQDTTTADISTSVIDTSIIPTECPATAFETTTTTITITTDDLSACGKLLLMIFRTFRTHIYL